MLRTGPSLFHKSRPRAERCPVLNSATVSPVETECVHETFEHRLLIGCRGWEQPGWAQTFYPDDLPADWRLTYYANQFRVVLVPPERLVASDAALADWVADTDEGFRFVCESPPDLDSVSAARDFLERIRPLGARCAGIRFPVCAELLNRPADLDVILGEWGAHYPISVDPMDTSSEAIDALLRVHRCGRCWHGPPPAAEWDHGRLALTVLAAPVPDLRALRALVEVCLAAATPERTAVLIVDAQASNLETAEQAGTIADLL